MVKIALEVFMWLHIERPAATNATLSPAQITQKLTRLSSWHMPIYEQSQNHLLQIQHQCYSFPLYASLILPEPVYKPTVKYHWRKKKLQLEQKAVKSETSSPPTPDNTWTSSGS